MSGNKLNKVQKAAVESIDGPILIFAGAGSGKTRVLTHKMYFLIKENHYKPEDILAVTFTNKAAKEMKERVMGLLKTDDLPITIGTFHSVFARLLRKEAKYLNISSGSRFQSNALAGVDQGMASITLRGLDDSATLLLLNSKRHTFSGTPSNKGNGYIDANIVPEIAINKIEILKEGATSIYGSDAIAGVINFFTIKKFDGFKVKIGRPSIFIFGPVTFFPLKYQRVSS